MLIAIRNSADCSLRLATSRPLAERSEPCLAAKRPTASDEVEGLCCFVPRHMKSDEGLLESLTAPSDISEILAGSALGRGTGQMKVRGERWEGEREEARLGESAPAFSLFPSSTARFLFFALALAGWLRRRLS